MGSAGDRVQAVPEGPPSPYLCEDDDGCLPSCLPALQVGQQLEGQRLDLPAVVLHHGPGHRVKGRAGLMGTAHVHPPATTQPRARRPEVLLSGVGTPLFDLLLLLLYPLATHWLPGVGQAWDGQGSGLRPWSSRSLRPR